MKTENIKKLLLAKFLMKSGHFNNPTLRVWDLAGDNSKETRRMVMRALTGKRLPIAKCGVTVISATFASLLECENREHVIEEKLAALHP